LSRDDEKGFNFESVVLGEYLVVSPLVQPERATTERAMRTYLAGEIRMGRVSFRKERDGAREKNDLPVALRCRFPLP